MELDAKSIQGYFEQLQGKQRKYKENEAYVKGHNPSIYRQPRKKAPDNRLPVPFAKMAVEDMAGYASRPGDIKFYLDNINTDDDDADEYNILLDEWKSDNEDDIEVSELYHKMLAHGSSYEVWWSEENNLQNSLPVKPQWKRVDGDSIIEIYTQDMKPTKEAAMYFRSFPERVICDVYFPLYSERWVKEKNENWKRDKEGDGEYPYTIVPVLKYTGNMDELPIFEAEKELIDSLDKLMSASANEIDRFNALKLLLPGLADKEFKDKLDELGVLDDLEQYAKWPEYLQKDLGGVESFYNALADRLERLFHKSIKIPDFTDDSFGSSDESGVARAYKLLGMEFKASMIETYFFNGLRQRMQLFNDIVNASTSQIDTDEYELVIDAKRNLPVDETAKADIAMKLMGIVSRETLIKMLPKSIVENVERELARLEEEGQQRVNMFGGDEGEE